MRKAIIPIGIFIGIVLIGVATYSYYKPLKNIAKMDADVEMEAVDLLSEFENNEVDANQKYLDKIIVVTGKILKVEESNNIYTVYFDTGNPMSTVICQMDKNQSIEKKENETISVKGICTGFLMDVVLVRAVLIN